MTAYLILALAVVAYLYSAAYCLTALHYDDDARVSDYLRAVAPITNTIIMLRDLRANW